MSCSCRYQFRSIQDTSVLFMSWLSHGFYCGLQVVQGRIELQGHLLHQVNDLGDGLICPPGLVKADLLCFPENLLLVLLYLLDHGEAFVEFPGIEVL